MTATTKEQATQVAGEAKKQIEMLAGQAQSELSAQAQAQQVKVANGLRSLGEQLSAMARGSDQPGTVTELTAQAADRAHDVAGWFEDRDPQGVLDEVRSFARRKPGTFLVAALGAGILAGRFTRGITADPAKSSASAENSPIEAEPGGTSRQSQLVSGAYHGVPVSGSRAPGAGG
ncbi:hypothetical protein GIS00_25090 [Nakamurella sp. YIM 132087]|uniref:Uncharacterized protein n=1 Tax=Nakamurella alba TaxID=2665158 RepID=A0A7K1FSZ9_9ACTN|nr:hypothetical protein [Nakamurella alba]MTD17210.1 hypothetical protein [Nakamurella alba]